MSDCCDNSAGIHPHRRRCPLHGAECAEVTSRTIAHHIKSAWEWQSGGKRYYFCDAPACAVAYFAEDDSLILKSQLRTVIGIKETSDDALVCYCFGVSRAAAAGDATIRDYVVEQTRQGLCSCETSNPSGRCCLKSFPGMAK